MQNMHVSKELGGQLTSVKVPTGDQEKYAGVSIKQFQKDTDHCQFVEFLCKNGLPAEKKDGVVIKGNGIVNVRNLRLWLSLHQQVPLYSWSRSSSFSYSAWS